MVCEWGMSEKLPNVFFGGEQEVFIGRDYQTQVNYGDEVASIIDEEIRRIIDVNYKRALQCLRDNKDILDNMVKLLFDRETIYGDEVDMLMEKRPLDEINAYIDEKLAKREEESKKKDEPIITPAFDKASTIIVNEKDIITTLPAPEDDPRPVASDDEKDSDGEAENNEKTKSDSSEENK